MNDSILTENELFSLFCRENVITIKFNVKHEIEFQHDIMFFDSDFLGKIRDRRIRIEGKGTVELYAFASYICVKGGCESLSVFDFTLSNYFEIYRKNTPAASSIPSWCSVVEKSDTFVMSVERSHLPDGRWPDELVRRCSFYFSYDLRSKPVVMTGRGSLLFYSVMAASVAASGCVNVLVEKPTENQLIRIFGDFAARAVGKKNGLMIGVLGDPNSGKSVFSKVFGCILQRSTAKSVWGYDCDAAAPTSDWYIYGLQRAKSQSEIDFEKRAREATKQKWSVALEKQVSERMKIVKSNLDIVVADFPGGWHDEKSNTHKRIPDSGRAEMLANCDSFVIIGRSDAPERIAEWKNALAGYGLSNRVIAEIISESPDAPPEVKSARLDSDGIFRAVLRGLDRKNDLGVCSDAFMNQFGIFLNRILC